MGLLIREKNDGSRAPGYAVYFLSALAAAAAVAALHRRADSSRAATTPRRAAHSNVASITQPAATMAKIEVKGRPSRTDAPAYRVTAGARRQTASSPVESAADAFNAIEAALAAGGPTSAARAAESRASDPGAAIYAKLPPAFDPGDNRTTRTAAEQLATYRDPAADTGPASSTPPHSPEGEPLPGRVPRGSLIQVCLLTTVDTGNPEAVIQFAADRDFIFNHRCQVPFGTRFLGKLANEAARDRLNLSASTIVYPDGTEIPISARVVEAGDDTADIRPGIAADYLPPPAWAQVAPYLAEAVGGTLGLLEARAQPQVALGFGGLNVQASTPGGDLRGPVYQSSAQAVQDFAMGRLKEFERREAGCHIIPAGTECWLQLDADLDLGVRSRADKSP